MDRKQFFGKLATVDEERLQKVLWNLYWRGTAAMRERIEAELEPEERERRKPLSKPAVDPDTVLDEVRNFVALARSGAYIAGDRRVSPRERTRWRFTFARLVTETQGALAAEDVSAGAAAMEQLIDLACEIRDDDYFRSEDPVEAARFVVSDAVALLWATLRERYGFEGFADRAAPQLIRWESRYGWTRRGDGRVSEKESSLASVLAGMLRAPDLWTGFADRYLDALDQRPHGGTGGSKGSRRPDGWSRDRGAADLAEWHLLLVDKLSGSEAEDRLDKLTNHAALGGPDLIYLKARVAHQRGDIRQARDLVHDSLKKLPGHTQFIDFAVEIDAPLPPRSREIATERQLVNELLR